MYTKCWFYFTMLQYVTTLWIFILYNTVFNVKESGANKAIYVGCFKDDTDRMYDFPIEKKKEGWIDGSMTINKCTEYCKFHKYIYSGLQYSEHCFCGQDYPDKRNYGKVNEHECNMRCNGEDKKCGGAWRQSVYRDCSILPLIQHCSEIDCESSHNKWCTKCEQILLYKLNSTSKRCEDKCSWENRWCWPGNCNEEFASNCKCMTGFRLKNNTCQPTQKPSFDSCKITAVSEKNIRVSSNKNLLQCSLQKDFYGRFQVEHFEINLMANYEISIFQKIISTRPSFVPNELFGVTDVNIALEKISVLGTNNSISNKDVKQDTYPERIFINENITVSTNEVLTNGERLCLTVNVKGGGYLVSKNLIHHTTHNVSYEKTENLKSLCYIYDIVVPTHCNENNTCNEEPLVLSHRVTNSRIIDVSFKGWMDPYPSGGLPSLASGVEIFEINIYEVVESTQNTLMRHSKSVGSKNITINTTSVTVELPAGKQMMLYCILLEVKDGASNAMYARRFVLYDNSSVIKINSRYPFSITSASKNTAFKWQTNHGYICYSWKNRYFNDKYKSNNPFRPIKSDSYGRLQGIYDQTKGLLPINGTQHVNGLTEFYYSLFQNDKDVLITGKLHNFTSETLCVHPVMNDGDLFILKLQAKDIMNHTLNDSATVFIDRSVPEITDIWLVRDGQEQLFVHHSKDLSKMHIQFKSFDVHSGLKQVRLSFGIYENKTTLIDKTLPVKMIDKEETCANVSTCYCPNIGNCSYTIYDDELTKLYLDNKHIGNHNRRYFFTIAVINTAGLKAVEHIDILVDESPPEIGVVLEGPVGSPDIDYTRHDDITIHWHDFIDHESGIKLYRVALARVCLHNLKDLTIGIFNQTHIKETDTHFIKIRFPDKEGQYFVSILAYNNAMSPSNIVCSDGITLDKTVPEVANIALKHAQIKQSIACSSGTPWLINSDLSKVKLHRNSCRSVCTNTTTDTILSILPEDRETKHDFHTISEFFCTTLDRYNRDIIYTPSDLFDISWNIKEDLSQIGNVFIGFGSHVSEIDHPDILGYVEVQQYTRYIQHHPGLIGEEIIFIFIKVLNKAGLYRKIWFGPVLADETPPLCPHTIQPYVEDVHVVIKWTNSVLFDLEQKEEIGKIMFRFGTTDKFVTSFLEWNIQTHAGQCGPGYQCIKYPVSRLQRYNTRFGSLFYAELHVYNYAEHYCTLTSLSIHLPSLFPPSSGIVLDVLPNSIRPYIDVDVIFDTNEYCFAWTGFDHLEIVQLQVGIGTKRYIDNVIQFHSITKNEDGMTCAILLNASIEVEYFVTIKASCSGGTHSDSSDGFIFLERNSVTSSMHVFHGDLCESKVKLESQISQFLSTNNIFDIYVKENLLPGSVYVLYSSKNVKILNTDVYIKHERRTSNKTIIHFLPITPSAKLSISFNNNHTNLTNSVDITLIECDTDQAVQLSRTLIPIHWSLGRRYSQYISHFLAAVCRSFDNQCIDELIFTNIGNHSFYNFNGHFTEGYYKAAVRPCFGQTCLPYILSKEFAIETISNRLHNVEATVIPGILCANTTITASSFVCSDRNITTYALAYRWALFGDPQGQNMLSSLKILRNQTEIMRDSKIQDNYCFELPVYSYKHLFVCIDSFCMSGSYFQSCSAVNTFGDPNTYTKDILYDIDSNSHISRVLHEYDHSENIGNKLSELHYYEMDFAERDVKIGGFISGQSGMTINWFLMRNQKLPKQKCIFDSQCLLSKNTTGGHVNFENPYVNENGVFFICAILSTQQKLCSNGFLIDDSSPVGGEVSVKSYNGYVIDGSKISIYWSGFRGNRHALVLGYQSDIAGYQYAIGTSISTDDLVGYSSVGLATSAVAMDLQLKAGQIYFVTLRARNYLNKTVDVHSEGVIYDNTPPTVGGIKVGSSLAYFVTSHIISVQWHGIEDIESGISTIEIGIGSNNFSADVIPFKEFEDNAEINVDGYFQDGHQYFAILKATNGAGLASFTVSEAFVIDTTPPEIGLVIDVLVENSEEDVDFQTETNSISASWFGFQDPHSHVVFYRIGLGISPGNDDVMKFTYVGLQTYKSWTIHFFQGIRYFTTVEACNGAGLCSTATSNGVIIDNSPPVPGLVIVGAPGKHSRYISDKHTLHSSWIGFQDPHSGIDHFEVCIGTSIDTCDIAKPLNVQLTASFTKTSLNMSAGVSYFVSITACNKVNLCIKRSSPRFSVDDTAPVLIEKPHVSSIHQIYSNSRQIISDPSFIKVFWKYHDNESPITKTILSIQSNIDSHISVEDTIISNEGEYSIHLSQKNMLRQGDIYSVKITSCNAASICKTAMSNEFLVDTTPPQIGGFRSPMDYEIEKVTTTLNLNLCWYGFVDIESDIISYYVSVGYTYSETQLVDSYKITPNTTNTLQQKKIITNISSSIQDNLVLTIWAENHAGLFTTEAKVTVDILPVNSDRSKGYFHIQKHSCQTYFCEDGCRCDCTCGVHGRKCMAENNVCTNDSRQIRPNVSVDVFMKTDTNKHDAIGSSKCLGAFWKYNSTVKIIRFEYSFGIKDGKIGHGVYNLSYGSIWNDVGKKNKAFHCMSVKQLEHNSQYVAYVRAWTSLYEYAIFQSSAVIVDHTPPFINKKHVVLDSLKSCGNDVDYVTLNDTVIACWHGVFSDDESRIEKFMVSLGTLPSVDDIVQMTEEVGQSTYIKWKNVKLEQGTRYYATVRAINYLGLQSEASSDGFIIDDIPPVTGIVYNTKHQSDVVYQTDNEPIQFSWHGFDDQHSFIDSYFVSFDISGHKGNTNSLNYFLNVGMSNSVFFSGILKHNDIVTANVKARDKAGHDSKVAMSQPLHIDATPPVSFTCENISHIKHHIVKASTDEYRWYETVNGTSLDVYQIKVQVNNPRIDFRTYLMIDEMSMLLPFALNADNSVITEYIYIFHENRRTNVSVCIYGIEPNTTVEITISLCSSIQYEDNKTNIILAQQISQNAISICVQTIDIESGIKLISVGVGSILDGLEIKSLYPIQSRLHEVIQANFSHKMKLYIKAEAENLAGLKTIFSSQPFIFDKTPPLIKEQKTTLEYMLSNNETVVILKSIWEVTDDESEILFCECCIGMSATSCDIAKMDRALKLTSFETKPFAAKHGSRIYITVQCINKVQLTGYNHFGPFVVSYLPPDSATSKIHFITDRSANSIVQRDINSITFHWDNFKEYWDKTYSVHVTDISSELIEWTVIPNKNYLRISDIDMKNSGNYTVCVKGRYTGGMESNLICNTLRIDKKIPAPKGNHLKIEHLSDNDYNVRWTNMYTDVHPLELYEVFIGSIAGYSDILMPTVTKATTIRVYIPEDIKEIFIGITVTSRTGMVETYRKTIILH